MKEFIDKLIERLEEESNNAETEMHILADSEYSLPCQFDRIDIEDCKSKTFCEAIQIVNQLAEEYKVSEMPTGWIPCSERLPEDRKEKLVYLSSNRMTIAIYNDHRLPHSDSPMGWGFPAPYFYIDFEKETVVAWCELPAPYTEGE